MKSRAEFYRDHLFPLLSRFDAETVHQVTLALFEMAQRGPIGRDLVRRAGCFEGVRFSHPELAVQVAGLTLENPLLLAAGFDKNGRAVRSLYELGFASVEVGTVTLDPQAGNPRPRLFRLPGQVLVNHLGFPNDGAAKVYANLLDYQERQFPLGVSLGVAANTSPEQAAQDLEALSFILAPVADYLVLNLSSPNTPGLRQLFASRWLPELLGRIRHQAPGKPVLLKISPDLTYNELDWLTRLVLDQSVNGVIATNTTIDYSLLPRYPVLESIKGGLSGAALRAKSTAVISHLYRQSGGKLQIIGSGGVDSLESLLEKISSGARAVSLYSGLVFAGPTLPSRLNRELLGWLRGHGTSLKDITGQPL